MEGESKRRARAKPRKRTQLFSSIFIAPNKAGQPIPMPDGIRLALYRAAYNERRTPAPKISPKDAGSCAAAKESSPTYDKSSRTYAISSTAYGKSLPTYAINSGAYDISSAADEKSSSTYAVSSPTYKESFPTYDES
jgi:hypothetical protein